MIPKCCTACLWLALVSTALWTHDTKCYARVKNIRVSPNSELGQAMGRMDAKGRAVQNAAMFSKALSDYEVSRGTTCTNVVFQTLREPGLNISRYVQLYTIEATASDCGQRIYHTRITFKDSAHTVAKKVDVLLGPEDEIAFRNKAKQFIECAKAGEVEQMLAMTSSQSHATQTSSIRNLYAEQVVPAFKNMAVEWQEEGEPCVDEKKNTGLEFFGRARGSKPFSFGLCLYQEKGQVVIANIAKNPNRPDAEKVSYE